MHVILTLLLGVMLLSVAGVALVDRDDHSQVAVYAGANCGCCEKWNRHLEEHGFRVKRYDEGVANLKKRVGIPGPFQACHTAVVEGYVIEGHVPADDVKTLLIERPDIVGLSVPGMPFGSPGMDEAAATANYYESYKVFALGRDGNITVFSEYPAPRSSAGAKHRLP